MTTFTGSGVITVGVALAIGGKVLDIKAGKLVVGSIIGALAQAGFHWGSGSRSDTSGLEGDRAVLRAVRLPPDFGHRPQAAPVGLGWAAANRSPLNV